MLLRSPGTCTATSALRRSYRPGSLLDRYPLANYQLDQYFPAISVGLISGVDVSGVAPMIAYFIAQVIWLITAFLANAVITLFAFAFNLDLVNGNGTPAQGR